VVAFDERVFGEVAFDLHAVPVAGDDVARFRGRAPDARAVGGGDAHALRHVPQPCASAGVGADQVAFDRRVFHAGGESDSRAVGGDQIAGARERPTHTCAARAVEHADAGLIVEPARARHVGADSIAFDRVVGRAGALHTHTGARVPRDDVAGTRCRAADTVALDDVVAEPGELDAAAPAIDDEPAHRAAAAYDPETSAGQCGGGRQLD